jgi:hypothetical protein
MKSRIVASALAIAFFGIATAPASARVVFNNPYDFNDANCAFNTECAFFGNTFAAQRFTLASATRLTSGTFTVLNASTTQPSFVNWLLLAADGADGLPGTLIASGGSVITSRTIIGQQFDLDIVVTGYGLRPVALDAGAYYIGLQAVSSEFEVYLGSASDFLGAARSTDGGTTWDFGYTGPKSPMINGIAVSLSSGGGVPGVPEPASWAMMIAGFGLVGAIRRRRARVAVVTA